MTAKKSKSYTAPAGSNSPATKSAKTLAKNLKQALATASKIMRAAPGSRVVAVRTKPSKPLDKAYTPAPGPKAPPHPPKKSRAAAAKADVKKSAPKNAAHPPKYDKPLESYSPYAQHRILLEKFGTDEAGQAKVFAHGVKVLGLPEGQVRTYIREKIGAILKDAQKKLGLHPSKPQLEKVKSLPKADAASDLDFKHASREDAKKVLLALVRRNQSTEQAFHILSENGKFAIAPAHIAPLGKPPALKTGDIVMDTTIADSRAEVVEGGAEQSTIRFISDRHYGSKEMVVSNYYLHKIGDKKIKAAVEAEVAEQRAKAAKKEPSAAVKKLAHKMADELAEDMAKLDKAAKKPAAKKSAKKAPAKKAKK